MLFHDGCLAVFRYKFAVVFGAEVTFVAPRLLML